MHSVVGFDLDGTLFDDRQYVRAGLERAGAELEAIAGVALTEELLAAYFERGIREETFDVVLDEHDLSPRHVPRLVAAYHDNDAPLTPYPGAAETLATLSATSSLALVTGGRNGSDKVARLGLAEHFDAVLVTDDRDHSKRDPDPFEHLLDRFDVAAGDAVYVGDRPALDFPQPNRLGMDTVRVETGRYATAAATGDARPDATIGSIAALPDVLAELH